MMFTLSIRVLCWLHWIFWEGGRIVVAVVVVVVFVLVVLALLLL